MSGKFVKRVICPVCHNNYDTGVVNPEVVMRQDCKKCGGEGYIVEPKVKIPKVRVRRGLG